MIMAADLAIKEPCRVATTANITLSGLQTVDGVSVSAGERVLVRAQSTASQNGIYVAASGAWSRATDFDGAGEVAGGTQVFVTSGTLFPDTVWRVAGNGAVTIGSAMAFDRELFMQAGTGAIQRPLEDKLRETLSARDYGATGDGVTDDTAAMLAFFNACIAQGNPGYIPAGTYLITLGQLLFDNNNVRTQWPNIMTAGAEAVKFVGTGTANEPIIEFRNGTYTGGAFDSLWIGGHLGGITFETATATAGTNRHGIKAYGMYGTHFGQMIGNSLGGSTIHLTDKKYAGTNPDPYAMGFCVFDSIEGYRNTGRTLDNRNFAGMTFCTVNAIRGIENVGGVLYGLGASNIFLYMSAGLCRGWAIDSGAEAEGQIDRSLITYAEIDGCEYGINLEKVGNADITKIRFVHRYDPLNLSSDDYWPRICINLADNSGGVADTKVEMIHRIEPGGDKADLGAFIDGNSTGNIGNVIIDQRIYPTTTGFTFADSDYYSNINVHAWLRLLRDGIAIYDTIPILAPIGYRGEAGAGGAVTQTISRSTAVTLDKLCGQITLVSAAGSTSPTSFTVNNSFVTSGDTIQLSQKSGTDKYRLSVTAVGSGSFQITYATWAGTTTEQPVFTFAIVNAEAS
jgi:hypothetical protein